MCKYRIDLLNYVVRPVHSASFMAGHKAGQFAATETNRMLPESVIEPAATGWSAPIVFTPEKDGTLHLCIDYHKLNAVTIRECYHLPCTNE